MIEAINSMAVPVLRYSFGIVQWKLDDLRKLDRKTRKLLTLHGAHHPKADVERLYLPRVEGGRGLLELEESYKLELIGLAQYLKANQSDTFTDIILSHDLTKKKYSITGACNKFLNELDINYEVSF